MRWADFASNQFFVAQVMLSSTAGNVTAKGQANLLPFASALDTL